MIRTLLCLLLGGLTALAAPAARRPDSALTPAPEVTGLPRVLLIGDSISMGYTKPVRQLLTGRANVQRPPENCGDTARGLSHLGKWLGTNPWQVIHFNFGLHDLKYQDATGKLVPPDQGKQVASLPQYEANLRQLVTQLKRTNAKLIFATTTPVPAGSAGRVEKEEIRYNEVALRVMKENGIAINDLHAFVVPQQEKLQLPRNVHFTPAGSDALAAAVAAAIRLELAPQQ